jgi:hypothetical protein
MWLAEAEVPRCWRNVEVEAQRWWSLQVEAAVSRS